MGSLEKIDNNNFVIKIKTSEIREFPEEDFHNDNLSWKLKSSPYDDNERVFSLKCIGLTGLWNIDARVTWNLFTKDGTKDKHSRINRVCFNSINPKGKYEFPYKMKRDKFDECYPNMEIRVKINSITGVEQESSRFDFEKDDDQLKDVAFVVEGKKLYANKALLATYSPVFFAMFFSDGFKESTDKEVIIKDVEYDDFKQFLGAIYIHDFYINEVNVERLLILADRYDVKVVKEKCHSFLCSADSIVVPLAELLILAETYTVPYAHRNCMNAINTKEMLTEVCKNTSLFGPMTLQAIIKKSLELLNE